MLVVTEVMAGIWLPLGRVESFRPAKVTRRDALDRQQWLADSPLVVLSLGMRPSFLTSMWIRSPGRSCS